MNAELHRLRLALDAAVSAHEQDHAIVIQHLRHIVEILNDVSPPVHATEHALGLLSEAWSAAGNRRDAEHRWTREVLQRLSDDQHRLRERLLAARAAADFETAYLEPEPLITVLIPTADNVDLLLDRSVPSVLEQTHQRFELLIVGDEAPPEVEAALRALGDPRIRYTNLSIGGTYPESGLARWRVAGATPANHGLALARGRWLCPLGDDDRLRPDHLATLLQHAKETRVEVAYGRFAWHRPEEEVTIDGQWPPAFAHHQAAGELVHSHLRFFEFSLADTLFDRPADWGRTERMLRAGVQYGMVQDVLYDYFPSRSWRTRAPLAEDQ